METSPSVECFIFQLGLCEAVWLVWQRQKGKFLVEMSWISGVQWHTVEFVLWVGQLGYLLFVVSQICENWSWDEIMLLVEFERRLVGLSGVLARDKTQYKQEKHSTEPDYTARWKWRADVHMVLFRLYWLSALADVATCVVGAYGQCENKGNEKISKWRKIKISKKKVTHQIVSVKMLRYRSFWICDHYFAAWDDSAWLKKLILSVRLPDNLELCNLQHHDKGWLTSVLEVGGES